MFVNVRRVSMLLPPVDIERNYNSSLTRRAYSWFDQRESKAVHRETPEKVVDRLLTLTPSLSCIVVNSYRIGVLLSNKSRVNLVQISEITELKISILFLRCATGIVAKQIEWKRSATRACVRNIWINGSCFSDSPVNWNSVEFAKLKEISVIM